MANLCQDDYAIVRPTEYFPETFRTGTCDACGEETFVARATKAEATAALIATLSAGAAIEFEEDHDAPEQRPPR